MRQRKDRWFAEQTIDKNSPVIGHKKILDPAHFVNGNEWSYNQQTTPLQLSDADSWVPSYRSGVSATLCLSQSTVTDAKGPVCSRLCMSRYIAVMAS